MLSEASRSLQFESNHGDRAHNTEIEFSYANINRLIPGQHIECSNYKAKVDGNFGNAFIHLNKDNKNRENRRTMVKKGWKFHISLFHGGDNLEKGWNIIKKHLISAQVQHWKVISDKEHINLSNDDEQNGKEITIYAFQENRSDTKWQKLFQGMTVDLVANRIIPGPLPPSNSEIMGSNYISYRYDNGKPRIKKRAVRLKVTNDDVLLADLNVTQIEELPINNNEEYDNDESPFSKIVITVPNQLLREVRKPTLLFLDPKAPSLAQQQQNVDKSDEKTKATSEISKGPDQKLFSKRKEINSASNDPVSQTDRTFGCINTCMIS